MRRQRLRLSIRAARTVTLRSWRALAFRRCGEGGNAALSARDCAWRDAYTKPRYDAATLGELETAIAADTDVRATYFDHSSSGREKSSAEALAGWCGYWCGLRMRSAAAFSECYCQPPQ